MALFHVEQLGEGRGRELAFLAVVSLAPLLLGELRKAWLRRTESEQPPR